MRYFRKCLDLLAKEIGSRDWKKVAFPYLIGCGLAGGVWHEYLPAIENMVKTLGADVNVVIVRREEGASAPSNPSCQETSARR